MGAEGEWVDGASVRGIEDTVNVQVGLDIESYFILSTYYAHISHENVKDFTKVKNLNNEKKCADFSRLTGSH